MGREGGEGGDELGRTHAPGARGQGGPLGRRPRGDCDAAKATLVGRVGGPRRDGGDLAAALEARFRPGCCEKSCRRPHDPHGRGVAEGDRPPRLVHARSWPRPQCRLHVDADGAARGGLEDPDAFEERRTQQSERGELTWRDGRSGWGEGGVGEGDAERARAGIEQSRRTFHPPFRLRDERSEPDDGTEDVRAGTPATEPNPRMLRGRTSVPSRACSLGGATATSGKTTCTENPRSPHDLLLVAHRPRRGRGACG